MDAVTCGWDSARFLIFSGNVFSPLIYYSHLVPLILSIILGIGVLLNNTRALVNRVLFFITLFFSLWVYFDLVLWASEKPGYIMFFWSMIVPIELLVYASSWYLVSIFAHEGKEPPLFDKVVALATFVPILLFAHTSYNLLGFDMSNCDREAIEGPIVQYLFLVQLLFVGWVLFDGSSAYRRVNAPAEKRQLLLITFGVALFLSTFVAGNILVTYFLELDWSYEQYKLFGMPILVAFITYSAIRFKTFDLKVFTAQALVMMLAVLVFSLLLVQDLHTIQIITALTFVLVCTLGYLLVRNVRKEIEQRVLIEVQEKELEVVNQQQESLLHFISHEVKGYLTDGQNTFAGIIEGDFGPVAPKAQEMSRTALGKMRLGVSTVMDILDASNMKRGAMQYKRDALDFKTAVEAVLQSLQTSIDAKKLNVETNIAVGDYTCVGDEEKLKRHVIRNLIDNAIRYTQQGTINVSLERINNKIKFSIKDSGVGITPEDMKRLFTEGGHGKDSIKTNVNSTGYGLFVAKSVVEAHGGKIWAQSDGQGKGSTFVVELPVIRQTP